MRKNENIVARKIHGSFFLIDISDNYSGDQCAIYEINETGMFIWEQINGARDIEELVALLKSAVIDDVDPQLLRDDVTEFIEYAIYIVDNCRKRKH